jgi:NhaP-type Na+/H+ or K+/H+ antiporter
LVRLPLRAGILVDRNRVQLFEPHFTMNTRRLRGLFGVALLASTAWAALGCLVGLVFQYNLIPGMSVFLQTPVPGGLPVAGALAGAMTGAINGLTFAGLLIATERGKNLEQIRMWRFAALSGVASGGTLGLLIQNLYAAGVGGVLGAIAGMAALWLARRAQQPRSTSMDVA